MKRKGIQCPSCGAYAFRMTFINMGATVAIAWPLPATSVTT